MSLKIGRAVGRVYTALQKKLQKISFRKPVHHAVRSDAQQSRLVRSLEWLILTALAAFFVALLILLFVWIWNVVTPIQWRWLSETDLGLIKNVVAGGFTLVVAGDQLQKRFK